MTLCVVASIIHPLFTKTFFMHDNQLNAGFRRLNPSGLMPHQTAVEAHSVLTSFAIAVFAVFYRSSPPMAERFVRPQQVLPY
jgi:hypothetical protein